MPKIDVIDNETLAVVHTIETDYPKNSTGYNKVFMAMMLKTDLDKYFIREELAEGETP